MPDSRFLDGAGPHANEQVNVTRMHEPIYREHNEPEDGYEPVPVGWILLALALALWGGWYLGTTAGDFEFSAYDGSPAAASGTAVAQAPVAVDPMVLGKRTFNNCMACHQADGKGITGQFPPLAGSQWVLGSPQVLARILLHGMQGDVEVLGRHYNGAMPAWGRFDDTQIAAVLTYIRASWGNSAAAIEPAVIAAERKATAGRTEPWTAAQLHTVAP